MRSVKVVVLHKKMLLFCRAALNCCFHTFLYIREQRLDLDEASAGFVHVIRSCRALYAHRSIGVTDGGTLN